MTRQSHCNKLIGFSGRDTPQAAADDEPPRYSDIEHVTAIFTEILGGENAGIAISVESGVHIGTRHNPIRELASSIPLYGIGRTAEINRTRSKPSNPGNIVVDNEGDIYAWHFGIGAENRDTGGAVVRV